MKEKKIPSTEPKIEDYYDPHDPRGISSSEFNKYHTDLEKWKKLNDEKISEQPSKRKRKKPDLVVWDEERGYYQRELTYGSNVGAPAIKLDDVQGWKKNQAGSANKQFQKKFEEIRVDFQKLVDEVNWNDLVYSSEYSFIPLIGETYHLYQRDNGTAFLSLIDPNSWNKKFIGSFTLDSNQKWIKLTK